MNFSCFCFAPVDFDMFILHFVILLNCISSTVFQRFPLGFLGI